MEVRHCIRRWLTHRVPEAGLKWLDEKSAAVAAGAPERAFFLAFSGSVRHAGKSPLDPTREETEEAARLRPGWKPDTWSCTDAARTLLVLSLPHDDPEAYVKTLDKVFGAADVAELKALYQALPLLPHPERHEARCTEGIRTNMTSVFCAIVHRNPYPKDHLDESAWNQMVLKALFVGVPLGPIEGLDERTNPKLARMLCDYAHERWAAHRDVSPELWRCVGPHADDEALKDLRKVLTEGTLPERKAAALALKSCPHAEAGPLLAECGPDLPPDLDWNEVVSHEPKAP